MTLATLLLIIAVVLLVLAAANVTSRVNLLAAGLACWALSQLVPLVA